MLFIAFETAPPFLIIPCSVRIWRAESGSHSPLVDRRAACEARHSPGEERANIRAPREIPGCGATCRDKKDANLPIGIFEQGSRSEPLPFYFYGKY